MTQFDWTKVKRGMGFKCDVNGMTGTFVCWSHAMEGPLGDAFSQISDLRLVILQDSEGGRWTCGRGYLSRHPEIDKVSPMSSQPPDAVNGEVEYREILAKWMTHHGFATGHGDTFEGLLNELSWQIAGDTEMTIETRAKPCVVFIRKNSTGEIRQFQDVWYGHDYIWSDGNFGCDCNRVDFFASAANEKEYADCDCGQSAYDIKIVCEGKNCLSG
jgi:hypothetical protein